MDNAKPKKSLSLNRRPVPAYVMNRQHQVPNTSSSSEDACSNNNYRPEHAVQLIPHSCGHTRGRSVDLLSVPTGLPPNRSQPPKKLKGNARRRSLPVGVTVESVQMLATDQSNERDNVQRSCQSDESKHRGEAVGAVADGEDRMSSAVSTTASTTSLPQKPLQEADGHLITYKTSGCIVTISTSKRSVGYNKDIYSSNQDKATAGPEVTIQMTDNNGSNGMKPPKDTIRINEKVKQTNLDKKTMDLRDKFEKKFNNASTFDSSFPMTSSPISKKITLNKADDRPASSHHPGTESNTESKSSTEILSACSQQTEARPKNRRRSSSLQRSKPVYKVKRDAHQVQYMHPDLDVRTNLPCKHHRTSSQDSVLTSAEVRSGSESNPTEILCVVTKDNAHAKDEKLVQPKADAKQNEDQDLRSRKSKLKLGDPMKLLEKGKLRDSKRSSKSSKHKRTLSAPSESILEGRILSMKKSSKLDDKNLRGSKRKKKAGASPSVMPQEGQRPLPVQKADATSGDIAHRVEQTHSAPDTTGNASCDVLGGVRDKYIPIVVSAQESDISTVTSNCFNILSKIPVKQNKAGKSRERSADCDVVKDGPSNADRNMDGAKLRESVVPHSSQNVVDNTRNKENILPGCGGTAPNIDINTEGVIEIDASHKRCLDEKYQHGPVLLKKAKFEYIVAGESTSCPQIHTNHVLGPGNVNDTNPDFLNTVAGCIERLEKGLAHGRPGVEAVVLQDSLFLDSSGRLHRARNYSPVASCKDINNKITKPTSTLTCSESNTQRNTTDENEGENGTKTESSSLALEHSIELPSVDNEDDQVSNVHRLAAMPHASARPCGVLHPVSKKATVHPRVRASPSVGQNGNHVRSPPDSMDISLPPRPASVPLSLPGEPPLFCAQDPRLLIAEAYSLSRSMNRVLDAIQQHINYKDAALLHMEYKLREERQMRHQLEARLLQLESMRRN